MFNINKTSIRNHLKNGNTMRVVDDETHTHTPKHFHRRSEGNDIKNLHRIK